MQFWVLVWDAGNFREHEAYGPYDTRSGAKRLADKNHARMRWNAIYECL